MSAIIRILCAVALLSTPAAAQPSTTYRDASTSGNVTRPIAIAWAG